MFEKSVAGSSCGSGCSGGRVVLFVSWPSSLQYEVIRLSSHQSTSSENCCLFSVNCMSVVSTDNTCSEHEEQDCSQADRRLLPPRGRGQDQAAGHQVPARLQCPEWSGQFQRLPLSIQYFFISFFLSQICSLLRGGIAERGGVRVGHRIIEINGQSVVAVPHERIVNLLATSVGEVRGTLVKGFF